LRVLRACVDCVTDLAMDCAADLAVPAAMPYPAEYNAPRSQNGE
jgi:hypothetical protein